MRPDVMSAGRQARDSAAPRGERGGALAVLRLWPAFLGIPQCPPGRLYTQLRCAPGQSVQGVASRHDSGLYVHLP